MDLERLKPVISDLPGGDRLLAALAHVAAIQEIQEEARAELREAKDAVGSALVEMASEQLADDALLPQRLLHELYWHWPDVRTGDLQAAWFVCSDNQVHRVAGPCIVSIRCPMCGTERTKHFTSRTGTNSPFSGRPVDSPYPYPLLCDDCRTKAVADDVERDERLSREHRRRRDLLMLQWEDARRRGTVDRYVETVEYFDGEDGQHQVFLDEDGTPASIW